MTTTFIGGGNMATALIGSLVAHGHPATAFRVVEPGADARLRLAGAFPGIALFAGGDRAKVNLARAQVQTLAEKVEQFEMDTGALPGALQDLVKAPGDAAGWLGPYAKESELKDPWNHPFEYAMPGEGRPFDLLSRGKDGEPGGDSVDADIKYE